jgi:hypothetical protein
MFILIPVGLQSALGALRNPRVLGNILSARVGIFAATAAVAAATYKSTEPTVMQPAAKPAPSDESQRNSIKRRSSMLEPANKHALVRAACARSGRDARVSVLAMRTFPCPTCPTAHLVHTSARLSPPMRPAEEPPITCQPAPARRREILGLRADPDQLGPIRHYNIMSRGLLLL